MKIFFMLQAVLALVLLGGCSVSTAPTTAASVPQNVTGIAVDGVTVNNAIIAKCDGDHLYYRQKCASCGFVSQQTIGTSFTKAPWTCTSDFTCPKCGATTTCSMQKDR